MIDQDRLLERLDQLVETVPPAELEAAVTAETTVAATLDAIFQRLASEFNPVKAKGRRGRFQFEVVTSKGIVEHFVHVENGVCTTGEGALPESDITIGLAFGDMLLMGMGRLPGARAFMTGKLKLRGNPLFGTKLGDWFDHPPA